MENNIELIKGIITKSGLVPIINVYDDDNKMVYNNGMIIKDNEIKIIKNAYDNIDMVQKNGIIINGLKYIMINIEKVNDKFKYFHIKRDNDSIICISIIPICIILNCIDDTVPFQNEYKINKLIDIFKTLY